MTGSRTCGRPSLLAAALMAAATRGHADSAGAGAMGASCDLRTCQERLRGHPLAPGATLPPGRDIDESTRDPDRRVEAMDTKLFQSAKAEALAGFAEMGAGHLNCAQAVVRFAAMVLGASHDSVVLARYFGGGMSRMGQVCGGLSGAALSLGLRDQCRGLSWPDGTSPDAERLQLLFREFEAKFGSTTCRALVGYLTDTAEGYERFKAEGKYASCEGYVSWACDHLYDILEATG